MSTVLFWFSSTGNSLAAARALASAIGGAEVVPLAAALRRGGEVAADSVGLVFPVYAFGVPAIVTRFLANVSLRPDAYVFSIVTMGGMAGMAHGIVKEALAARGCTLANGWSLVMPGNYTVLYGAPSTASQEKCFVTMRARIAAIAGVVRERRRGVALEDSSWLLRWVGGAMSRSFAARVATTDEKFFVQDHCTHCGVCAGVCPVGNIRMVDGRPEWCRQCEHCMACLQWCPVQAIQYGRMTCGRRRYHHPEVSVKDIMRQRES